jgi:hypothetical protein
MAIPSRSFLKKPAMLPSTPFVTSIRFPHLGHMIQPLGAQKLRRQ